MGCDPNVLSVVHKLIIKGEKHVVYVCVKGKPQMRERKKERRCQSKYDSTIKFPKLCLTRAKGLNDALTMCNHVR